MFFQAILDALLALGIPYVLAFGMAWQIWYLSVIH
jgi:hypothetical protein